MLQLLAVLEDKRFHSGCLAKLSPPCCRVRRPACHWEKWFKSTWITLEINILEWWNRRASLLPLSNFNKFKHHLTIYPYNVYYRQFKCMSIYQNSNSRLPHRAYDLPSQCQARIFSYGFPNLIMTWLVTPRTFRATIVLAHICCQAVGYSSIQHLQLDVIMGDEHREH